MDSDRHIRRFCVRYRQEHAAFAGSIRQVPHQHREAYASRLLHRLMFVYFIQKKGLLASDPNYLRNHLAKHKEGFHQFVLKLLHEGLGRPKRKLSQTKLLGKVPWLGANLFSRHNQDGDGDIPYRAYLTLFNFFDTYHWRINDDSSTAGDKITPGILGSILEQHINQKHMGAYYTKDDITSYICHNTIIPCLFSRVAADHPSVFPTVAGLLAKNPDRYIHDAVRKGFDRPLPPKLDIQDQLRASTPCAVGRETWRQHLARRERCRELRSTLQERNATHVHRLISLNLNILRVALDFIEQCRRPPLLLKVFKSLSNMTILDPTCGSGAFLLAALRTLEPLYQACFERMDWFVSRQPEHETTAEFRGILGLEKENADRTQFIATSILRYNLYGVDIMEEAIEVCKMRLWLRALANVDHIDHIEPIPHLESNIKTGNVLQRVSSPPIQQGFDVVIGNPPYLSARKVPYQVTGFQTQSCPDIYAWCLERAEQLTKPQGYTGMIVPLSLAFSRDFDCLRKLLFNRYAENWFASFGRIPSALFNHDVRVRNTIHLGAKASPSPGQHTTRLHRWFDDERPHLFEGIQYARFDPAAWRNRIPRLGSQRLCNALEACLGRDAGNIGNLLKHRANAHRLYFKKTGYNWLAFSPKPPPCFDERGRPTPQSQLDVLFAEREDDWPALYLLLNGKIAFAYWCAVGDDFHVTKQSLADLPVPDLDRGGRLADLARRLQSAMADALVYKRNAGKKVGSYNLARCRQVTDAGDRWFASRLGLDHVIEEIDLFCDQMVRTDIEMVAEVASTS